MRNQKKKTQEWYSQGRLILVRGESLDRLWGPLRKPSGVSANTTLSHKQLVFERLASLLFVLIGISVAA